MVLTCFANFTPDDRFPGVGRKTCDIHLERLQSRVTHRPLSSSFLGDYLIGL